MTEEAITTVEDALKEPYTSELFDIKFSSLIDAMESIKKNDPAYFEKTDRQSFFNGMMFSSAIDFGLYLKNTFEGLKEEKNVIMKVYNEASNRMARYVAEHQA